MAAADLPPLPRGLALSNVLLALEDDEPVGVVALEVYARVGLLRSLAVAEPRRRSGIGRSLVKSLQARANELGLRELYLLTLDAEGFFEQMGFEEVPREDAPPEIRGTRLFREHCPEQAKLMRLGLEARF